MTITVGAMCLMIYLVHTHFISTNPKSGKCTFNNELRPGCNYWVIFILEHLRRKWFSINLYKYKCNDVSWRYNGSEYNFQFDIFK